MQQQPSSHLASWFCCFSGCVLVDRKESGWQWCWIRRFCIPQGGGQPFDTGSIETGDGAIKFWVTDVRAKSGVVSSEAFTDGMNRLAGRYLLICNFFLITMFLISIPEYGNQCKWHF